MQPEAKRVDTKNSIDCSVDFMEFTKRINEELATLCEKHKTNGYIVTPANGTNHHADSVIINDNPVKYFGIKIAGVYHGILSKDL